MLFILTMTFELIIIKLIMQFWYTSNAPSSILWGTVRALLQMQVTLTALKSGRRGIAVLGR